MNQEEINKHPLIELLKKTTMYLEEPGDPIWEKIRFSIEAELKMSDTMINEVVWKAMIFDTLHKAFNANPEVFSKRRDWVVQMLMGAFDHLNQKYEQER